MGCAGLVVMGLALYVVREEPSAPSSSSTDSATAVGTVPVPDTQPLERCWEQTERCSEQNDTSSSEHRSVTKSLSPVNENSPVLDGSPMQLPPDLEITERAISYQPTYGIGPLTDSAGYSQPPDTRRWELPSQRLARTRPVSPERLEKIWHEPGDGRRPPQYTATLAEPDIDYIEPPNPFAGERLP